MQRLAVSFIGYQEQIETVVAFTFCSMFLCSLVLIVEVCINRKIIYPRATLEGDIFSVNRIFYK